MIPFGLYTGQRLADVATLRWDNLDLAKDEIRFTTRKTGRPMILPIAKPPGEYLRGRASDRRDLRISRSRWEQRRLGEAASLLRDRHFVKGLGHCPRMIIILLWPFDSHVHLQVLPGNGTS